MIGAKGAQTFSKSKRPVSNHEGIPIRPFQLWKVVPLLACLSYKALVVGTNLIPTMEGTPWRGGGGQEKEGGRQSESMGSGCSGGGAEE